MSKLCGRTARRNSSDGNKLLTSFTVQKGGNPRQHCEWPRGTWAGSRRKTRWTSLVTLRGTRPSLCYKFFCCKKSSQSQGLLSKKIMDGSFCTARTRGIGGEQPSRIAVGDYDIPTPSSTRGASPPHSPTSKAPRARGTWPGISPTTPPSHRRSSSSAHGETRCAKQKWFWGSTPTRPSQTLTSKVGERIQDGGR